MRHVLAQLRKEGEEPPPRGQAERKQPRKDLVVITGRGRRSGKEGPQLGAAVLDMLSEQLEPPVRASVVAGNEGRVLVDGSSLDRWLREADANAGSTRSSTTSTQNEHEAPQN